MAFPRAASLSPDLPVRDSHCIRFRTFLTRSRANFCVSPRYTSGAVAGSAAGSTAPGGEANSTRNASEYCEITDGGSASVGPEVNSATRAASEISATGTTEGAGARGTANSSAEAATAAAYAAPSEAAICPAERPTAIALALCSLSTTAASASAASAVAAALALTEAAAASSATMCGCSVLASRRMARCSSLYSMEPPPSRSKLANSAATAAEGASKPSAIRARCSSFLPICPRMGAQEEEHERLRGRRGGKEQRRTAG